MTFDVFGATFVVLPVSKRGCEQVISIVNSFVLSNALKPTSALKMAFSYLWLYEMYLSYFGKEKFSALPWKEMPSLMSSSYLMTSYLRSTPVSAEIDISMPDAETTLLLTNQAKVAVVATIVVKEILASAMAMVMIFF